MKFQDLFNLDLLTPANPDVARQFADRDVASVTSDSRKAGGGVVFVALVGTQTDGHQYIRKAVEAGAVAVVAEKTRRGQYDMPENVPVFEANNTYEALGALSSRMHGDPGRRLKLVGVTGTNGKTTVTHLIEKMIADWGKSVGLVGTLGQRSAKASAAGYTTTGLTTPLAIELHGILAGMVSDGMEYVVMEVSSHALEQYRVYGCDFLLAVHTNLTQDHLDYHMTMEKYCDAKCLLFSRLDPAKNPSAVINRDDPWSDRFLAACPEGIRIYTYGIKSPEADVRPESMVYSIEGATFKVVTPQGSADVKLRIAGEFSVYNALAAIAGGLALGIPLKQCVRSLEEVRGVRGRFEVVATEPFVIVDYAHTPDGLENILSAARQVTPEGGRLVAVFGCGGDRDATKRPKMGAIAERLADVLVVTSDNPRTEDPQQIITDILNGIRKFDPQRMVVDPDRRKAIHQAIDLANPNDIIVVAGKGHEDYQILADRTIHFDDREVVQDYVRERGKGQPVPSA